MAYHKTAAALSPSSLTGLTDIEDIVPWIRFLVSEGWWMAGQTILVNGLHHELKGVGGGPAFAAPAFAPFEDSAIKVALSYRAGGRTHPQRRPGHSAQRACGIDDVDAIEARGRRAVRHR